MNETLEIPLDDKRLAVAQPTPMDLMQQVIKSGITADSVAVMERLVVIDREMRKESAEREYVIAFNALQRSLKTFKATKVVPGKDKNGQPIVKYTYLPYDEIMAAVQPLAEQHGL